MLAGRRVSQLRSKFVTTYSKILYVQDFAANLQPAEWAGIILLPIERDSLENEVGQAPKENCLEGTLKPAINAIFSSCLDIAQTAADADPTLVANALETLMIVVRAIGSKSLSGWEFMEVFAGGVDQSDRIFMHLIATLDELLGNSDILPSIRHQGLQLALIFISTVGQLSPGAYFLRRDLFPSIITFMKDPDTQKFSFEALLFISSLTNFHKSDAAKLNPYLKRVEDCTDEELMRKISWSSNYAISMATKTYQDIFDDSPPPKTNTIASSVGAFLTSLRPDRVIPAFSDPPKDAFKNQPIEASVILLPIYEFLRLNRIFCLTLKREIMPATDSPSPHPTPLCFRILTLSSYLLTHASSITTSSPRPVAYANLALSILLAFVENVDIMQVFCPSPPSQDSDDSGDAEGIWEDIRLCRQRLPLLPLPPSKRPAICALLDCCILWLRHNMQKRLEVASYTMCIWICHRVIWHLQKHRIRLEYNWTEFWSAILTLLEFLSTKLESLISTGGIENLTKETIALLDVAISQCEAFLPTPRAVHEFIYELVRSSSTLKRQTSLLATLSTPFGVTRRESLLAGQSSHALQRVLETVAFYEDKVLQAGDMKTAEAAMSVIAKEIEANGLQVKGSIGEGDGAEHVVEEPILRCEDVVGFSRFASADVLGLMP